MTAPTALIVCGDGINCEAETAHALKLVGFQVQAVHVSDLLKQPEKLRDVKLFCIPGGFSFGDEIASGKVLAVKMRQHMQEQLQEFIAKQRLVLGICNGFQVLVQLGLLPFPEAGAERVVSLTHNKQKKFLNRWVSLEVASNSSNSSSLSNSNSSNSSNSSSSATDVFFKSLTKLDLPMRHGEGNLKLDSSGVVGDAAHAEVLRIVKEHASLRYVEDVNGSLDRIAALSSKNGTVMGLMPHPEAFVRFSQHPRWTNRDWLNEAKGVEGALSDSSKKPAGLVIFENAYAYVNCAN